MGALQRPRRGCRQFELDKYLHPGQSFTSILPVSAGGLREGEGVPMGGRERGEGGRRSSAGGFIC